MDIVQKNAVHFFTTYCKNVPVIFKIRTVLKILIRS